ncbi:MAG: carboxypeptidase regulatory-like domain-containing protein [Candidatus Sericytochromatia bacterium]|nr:carboxypeptidase regulatory-like domain-containing protein [Candidatus Sericytochromatia bacterium]
MKAPGSVNWPTSYLPANNTVTASPSPAPSTGPYVAPKGKGKVNGTVIDMSGRPLGNVKITVDAATGLTASTDANGSFHLADVPAGWQFVTCNYEGQIFPGSVNVLADGDTKMAPITYDNRYNGFGNQANGYFELPIKKFPYEWRITGVSSWSGTIYTTAVDNGGTLKAGTVFRMDTRSEKTWTEIGDQLFGVSRPLRETAAGLAMGPDRLYITDGKAGLFSCNPQKGSPKKAAKAGMTDVTVGGGKVFVKTDSGVQVTDEDLTSFTTLAGMTATGGIGADPTGNLYAVSGNTIKRYAGKAETFISGLSAPIDVAADRQGFIYVLEQTNVKRFDATGQIVGVFPISAAQPVAISCDESGAVFVADQGKAPRPSRVLRFTPASKPGTPQPSPTPYDSFTPDGSSGHDSGNNAYNASPNTGSYGY